MNVRVKLFGNLRRLLPPGQEEMELTVVPGTSVAEVIRQYGVDDGEVGLAVVNGVIVEETAVLQDGDCLELFAVIGGGSGDDAPAKRTNRA